MLAFFFEIDICFLSSPGHRVIVIIRTLLNKILIISMAYSYLQFLTVSAVVYCYTFLVIMAFN